jgi:hypothetical protein
MISGSVFSVDDSAANHTYTIQTYISDCRYWDIATESWAVEGCKVKLKVHVNANENLSMCGMRSGII